ncbi:ankyrin repeat-containing domain protein [Hypoxylon trugodes]|uniref:ankyrin repeat-containing domain protein n=1 Tax=Hypoxylon trugodes TaxID=326681 RepID=UPI00219AD4E1|nr:ankyrin repeat-containing domain protein [Hypoxylon trugodes]KAI1390555.1 ankyrin repeat-containing domain protein [Hypoxylon trugodes]
MSIKFKLDELRKQLEAHATEEFELAFSFFTHNMKEYAIPTPVASKAIIEMARRGFSNATRKLIQLGITPSLKGRRSETALHIFAYSGDAAMTRFLIEKGVDPNTQDKDKQTPLHWAAWAGKAETVVELLSMRTDEITANMNAIDVANRTALYGAAGGGFADVVRYLLQRGADVTIRGGTNQETPLERARKRNHAAVIDLLTKH